MSVARTYSDAAIDLVARETFVAALRRIQRYLFVEGATDLSSDALLALAAAATAAAGGFEPTDTAPANLNDDIVDELCRSVFVEACERVKAYIKQDHVEMHERLYAYAQIADAASCGLKENEEGNDDGD